MRGRHVTALWLQETGLLFNGNFAFPAPSSAFAAPLEGFETPLEISLCMGMRLSPGGCLNSKHTWCSFSSCLVGVCGHLDLWACMSNSKTPKLSGQFLLCRPLDAPSRDAGQAAPLSANVASGQLRPLPICYLVLCPFGIVWQPSPLPSQHSKPASWAKQASSFLGCTSAVHIKSFKQVLPVQRRGLCFSAHFKGLPTGFAVQHSWAGWPPVIMHGEHVIEVRHGANLDPSCCS